MYINFLRASGKKESDLSPIQDGKWDAAFKKTGKDNIGFNFAGSPFGTDTVDIYTFNNKMLYTNLFNGFIYYRSMNEWKLITDVNDFIDNSFAVEFMRRTKLTLTALQKDLNRLNDEFALLQKFKDKYNKQVEVPAPNKEKIQEAIDKWIY